MWKKLTNIQAVEYVERVYNGHSDEGDYGDYKPYDPYTRHNGLKYDPVNNVDEYLTKKFRK